MYIKINLKIITDQTEEAKVLRMTVLKTSVINCTMKNL